MMLAVMEMMNKKAAESGSAVVAAGFLVFRRLQGRVEYLLLQTSYGQHHWTPPKGHVDAGESELDAAGRETEEEAGLKLSQLKVYKNFERELNYLVNDKPKRVVYWLAELLTPRDPIKLSHEHQSFKWLTLTEACTLAAFPDMVGLLQDADAFVNRGCK